MTISQILKSGHSITTENNDRTLYWYNKDNTFRIRFEIVDGGSAYKTLKAALTDFQKTDNEIKNKFKLKQ
jgi:hypothetical protein